MRIDVTEEEIRRSGAEVVAKSSTPEATAERMEALLFLWKKGALLPECRNAKRKIIWTINPDFDPDLLR
jgi:hypothetical protein